MKTSTILFSLALSVFLISCADKPVPPEVSELNIKAPFGEVVIKTPSFAGCREFSISDFGAVPGNKEKTTSAISEAISAASAAGGGTVLIPEGEWLTGSVHLLSNVNLHLAKNAVLLFSGDPDDYLPAVHSSWEGVECMNYSPLIYAYECENIAITGEGKLKAIMDTWETWFARPRGHMNSLKQLYYMAVDNVPVEERMMVNDSAHFRPQFIQFNRCKTVLLEGFSIVNSPFWTIHLYHSEDIVLRDLNVYAHGHNNDGVDPEMSSNVLIENCTFDQGDDAIAIKAGRNQDAWRLDMPSKNIVMKHLRVKNGHQLVAIGSELSGGIENVFADSCIVENGAKMNHLLYIKTNERRGGYVKNIYMSNVSAGKMDKGIFGIETDVLYQWRDLVPTIERRLTPISDIHLSDVHVTDVGYVAMILGQEELPVNNVSLVHVMADTIHNKETITTNVVNFNKY